MKTLQKILAFTLCVIIFMGCSCTPKSPIEKRFDKYVNDNNLKGSIEKIDSIVKVDSVNIMQKIDEIKIHSDTLQRHIQRRFNVATNNLSNKSNSFTIALELSDIFIKYMKSDECREENLQKLQDRMVDILDDNDEQDCYYVTHNIYVSSKSGQDKYIALTIGFQDTIIIDKELENIYSHSYTLKSKRLNDYIKDYYREAILNPLVVADKLDVIISKYNLK